MPRNFERPPAQVVTPRASAWIDGSVPIEKILAHFLRVAHASLNGTLGVAEVLHVQHQKKFDLLLRGGRQSTLGSFTLCSCDVRDLPGPEKKSKCQGGSRDVKRPRMKNAKIELVEHHNLEEMQRTPPEAKMRQKCGKDAANMWQRCGKDAANVWRRGGEEAAKMRLRCGSGWSVRSASQATCVALAVAS